MDITRLTSVLGADASEVEALIIRMEERAPGERGELRTQLAQALRLSDAGAGDGSADDAARQTPRTDVADAVAADLGFD